MVDQVERERIHDVPLAEHLRALHDTHVAQVLRWEAEARAAELEHLLLRWDSRRLQRVPREPLDQLIPTTMRALGMEPLFCGGHWVDANDEADR